MIVRPPIPFAFALGVLGCIFFAWNASRAEPPLATNAPPISANAIFEHVSVNEGIAPDLVFCMHQDRRGFVWLGTMYGLLRFDGSTYVSFRNDPFDSTSISNDDVVAIAEDDRGDLWLATYGGGVNRYDRTQGRFDPPNIVSRTETL